MEANAISAFDMLKIGIGPSSSHTLGPWRAVQRWMRDIATRPFAAPSSGAESTLESVEVVLYGSLALTGKGHATDKAITLALLGHDPETVDVARIPAILDAAGRDRRIPLRLVDGVRRVVPFDPATDIRFRTAEQLPGHANGMKIIVRWSGTVPGTTKSEWTYYSIGGGFVIEEGEAPGSPPSNDTHPNAPADTHHAASPLPHPFDTGAELLAHCRCGRSSTSGRSDTPDRTDAHHGDRNVSIAEIMRRNEAAWRAPDEIDAAMMRIWTTMRDSVWRGCHTPGELPGGLRVLRRAYRLHHELMGDAGSADPVVWLDRLRHRKIDVARSMRWISCFAMAVNEENASMGRVVTAPTNGAAGVIPAVLMQHIMFSHDEVTPRRIVDFLLVSAAVGSLFKKGATISAAMGGCQAEIGVSSAMAAAALTELRGGSPDQALMAAEIAMEHHLGLTCDPIAGLVQIPCIERNAMGAVKAINAAELALASRPDDARVSLDQVIASMWETAQDMHMKYKETSLGGLAVNIPVNISEC